MVMAPNSMESRILLNNGIEIPVLGLGVWQMSEGKETEEAVLSALRANYRLIDTAKLYKNEISVGKSIRESQIPREEIFVTTKLLSADFYRVEAAFEESLSKLDLGYIDLYLIHWPRPIMKKSIWQKLEKIYEQKMVRAIGVSNYTVSNLKDLLSYANIPPAVNQIELNPFSYEKELLDFCQKNKITIEAYSPLNRGRNLNHPLLQKISQEYGKTPAQILIRWALEHETIPIPKSSNEKRIRENAAVFDFTISPSDIESLNRLSGKNSVRDI